MQVRTGVTDRGKMHRTRLIGSTSSTLERDNQAPEMAIVFMSQEDEKCPVVVKESSGAEQKSSSGFKERESEDCSTIIDEC